MKSPQPPPNVALSFDSAKGPGDLLPSPPRAADTVAAAAPYTLDDALDGLVDGIVQDERSLSPTLLESSYAEPSNYDPADLLDDFVQHALDGGAKLGGPAADDLTLPTPTLQLSSDSLGAPPLGSPRPDTSADPSPPFADFESPQSLDSATSFTTAYDGSRFSTNVAGFTVDALFESGASPASAVNEDLKPRALHLDVDALENAAICDNALSAATALTENSVMSSLGALPALASPLVTATDLFDDSHKGASSVVAERAALDRKLQGESALGRLRAAAELCEKHLDVVFALATVATFVWGILLAFVAAYNRHFGVAAAQAAASGAGSYLVQKRKDGAREVLSHARSLTEVDEEKVADKVSDKVVDLVGSALSQGFDSAVTLASSLTAPISIAIPAAVTAFLGVQGFWSELGIQAFVAALGLPLLAAGIAFYGRIRTWAVGKLERAIEPHVDAIVDVVGEHTPLLPAEA